ncbi:MAG TPA: adenylate/guanylate cyclase domain-containing protein [Candidatus Limnocylindrales bacterium]|nr:adenylate/guanylate cyclase domain-containing protein [Candidatus Limnocylindrales bacterium]
MASADNANTAGAQGGLTPARLRFISIVLSAAVVVLGLWADRSEPWPVPNLHNVVFDAYQRTQPRAYQPVPVRIVDVDEASLAKLGQWPWPRDKVAQLVSKLRDLGASAIVFDVLFAEPDRTSPSWLAAEWKDKPDVASVLDKLPDHDAALAEELRRGNVVVGFSLIDEPGGSAPIQKGRYIRKGDPSPIAAIHAQGTVVSLPILQEAASGNGAINFAPDQDGVVRRVPLFVRHGDELYPSLDSEALRVSTGTANYALTTYEEPVLPGVAGLTSVRIANYTIPTDTSGDVLVYLTTPVAERYVPAWKVMLGEAAGLIPKGSIVYVGTSATGLMDLRFGPLGKKIPGVEIHAQLTEQAMLGVFATRPKWVKGLESCVMVVAWLIMLGFGSRRRVMPAAIATAVLMILMTAGAIYAWRTELVLADPLLASLVLLATFVAYTVPRQLATESEGQWIRGVFANYLSPNLVEHLIQNPGELRLGGERRECSFVLTDVAGFTTLVEGIANPQELTEIINNYLEGMVSIAFEHDGTLDRIVGDAVAVLFSAPVTQPDHPERAVRCALAMDKFAHEYSMSCTRQDIPFGMTRIGVHTGEVVVGNFGGSSHFDYRPLGDPINTAARLETANRQLGTRICVSGATVSRCPNFTGRPAGSIQLKGKTLGVEVFEAVSPSDPRTASMAAYLAAFEKMAAEDPSALDAFAGVVARWPDDGLAAFHLARLRRGETGANVVFTEK